MLTAFSDHIRESFERRAREIDYPVEAVIEMAIVPLLVIQRKLQAYYVDWEH